MRETIITIAGVIARAVLESGYLVTNRLIRMDIFLAFAIFALVPAGLAYANPLYYDDGSTTDLASTIFSNSTADPQQNGYGCVGCHSGGTASCTVGTGATPPGDGSERQHPHPGRERGWDGDRRHGRLRVRPGTTVGRLRKREETAMKRTMNRRSWQCR